MSKTITGVMPIRTVGLTPGHRWCGELRSVKPAVNNGKGARGLVQGPNSLNASYTHPGRISGRPRKLASDLRNRHLGRPIKAAVGDVIQIRPFSFPVGRDFIGAKLKVDLPRDPGRGIEWVLHYIGQVEDSSAREGRMTVSAFFLVGAVGRQDIHVSLIDGDGQPLGERYRRAYVVRSSG